MKSSEPLRADAELAFEVAREVAGIVPTGSRHHLFDAEERRLNQLGGILQAKLAREARRRGSSLLAEQARQVGRREIDCLRQLFDRERRGAMLLHQRDDVADADVVPAIHAIQNYNARAELPVRSSIKIVALPDRFGTWLD